ncbi:unnamed protein product, partial [Staurois parvus]
MLTPSCPVPLVKSQWFLLALITVLVSLGMSVTPSQFRPVTECPTQSYSPTISRLSPPLLVKIKKEINSSIYTAICKSYNCHVNQLI